MAEPESEYEEIFKKGTIVEVSSEDEGLRGSWYTATVLRTISRKSRKIFVEYHNLMEDDAGSKHLCEFVDAILVRPIPPREPHRIYSLMDDVDAFHNDGWWEGVVTRILESSNCYSVFFRCSREQIDFCSSDLRLHREWVRGNLWVPPLEHHASPSSGQRKRSGEDGRNGSHTSCDKGRVTSNGVERDVRRKSANTPTKQDGFVSNGRCTEERRRSNRSITNDIVAKERKDVKLRISSNGACKKHELVINGKLKDPQRRASKNSGFLLARNDLFVVENPCEEKALVVFIPYVGEYFLKRIFSYLSNEGCCQLPRSWSQVIFEALMPVTSRALEAAFASHRQRYVYL
uniref:Agenet domain-containing protein n=1 Tax=Chenopodium quinoa TaxID=63459 RepID=A0A803M7D9_CHEQI